MEIANEIVENQFKFVFKYCVMKVLPIILGFILISLFSQAQIEPKSPVDTNTYIIVTNTTELVGKILRQDSAEVKVLTTDNREVIVPAYLIKSIEVLDRSEFDYFGTYVGKDAFATRYIITTNGLPLERGKHYVQWNLFGPDVHFSVRENLSLGIMTTWVAAPIIGTFKKSWQLNDQVQLAVGGLAGTGSWLFPRYAGALPFGSVSFGDRTANLSLTAGYGVIASPNKAEGRLLFGVAGITKVTKNISLLFDSVVMPWQGNTQGGFALLMPAVRIKTDPGEALQIGVAGLITNDTYDSDFPVIPLPVVQWYRSF